VRASRAFSLQHTHRALPCARQLGESDLPAEVMFMQKTLSGVALLHHLFLPYNNLPRPPRQPTTF
jgi:hypothetical protein